MRRCTGPGKPGKPWRHVETGFVVLRFFHVFSMPSPDQAILDCSCRELQAPAWSLGGLGGVAALWDKNLRQGHLGVVQPGDRNQLPPSRQCLCSLGYWQIERLIPRVQGSPACLNTWAGFTRRLPAHSLCWPPLGSVKLCACLPAPYHRSARMRLRGAVHSWACRWRLAVLPKACLVRPFSPPH